MIFAMSACKLVHSGNLSGSTIYPDGVLWLKGGSQGVSPNQAVVSDHQGFLSQTSYANMSIAHRAHDAQVAIATVNHDD